MVCNDLFKSLENEYIPSNTPEKAIKKKRNIEDNIVTYNCWLEKEINRMSIITPTTELNFSMKDNDIDIQNSFFHPYLFFLQFFQP